MENKRPTKSEYAEYYETYIGKIEGDNLISILKNRTEIFIDFLESIPEDKWLFAYDEGKWTIKEVLIHIIDTERVFTYRALRCARNDATPMVGFDQNDFVPNSNSNKRSIPSIIEEYTTQRLSTIAMYSNFTEQMATHLGKASGYPVTARSIGFMIAGHEKHHHQILMERYL